MSQNVECIHQKPAADSRFRWQFQYKYSTNTLTVFTKTRLISNLCFLQCLTLLVGSF